MAEHRTFTPGVAGSKPARSTALEALSAILERRTRETAARRCPRAWDKGRSDSGSFHTAMRRVETQHKTGAAVTVPPVYFENPQNAIIMAKKVTPEEVGRSPELHKHLRKFVEKYNKDREIQPGDGQEITLGYCHAIRTFPYRTPDFEGCKRFSPDPKKVLFAK